MRTATLVIALAALLVQALPVSSAAQEINVCQAWGPMSGGSYDQVAYNMLKGMLHVNQFEENAARRADFDRQIMCGLMSHADAVRNTVVRVCGEIERVGWVAGQSNQQLAREIIGTLVSLDSRGMCSGD